jgi:asparagine synthase (glutamine-hydrolysing)
VAQAGFELLFPYFDRDLVELSLRMPPAHLIAGGGGKAPLRRLVAARLPSVSMPKRKILFDGAFESLFRRHGRNAWAALGGPRVLTDLDIVDPVRVRAWMDSYFSRASDESLGPWFMLSMESWLQARSNLR